MAQNKSGKGWAWGAFILGIVSIILCWIPIFGLILSIVAIVISGIALKKVEANKGLIIAALVMGIIALLIALGITLVSLAIFGIFSSSKNAETENSTQGEVAQQAQVTTLGQVWMSAENFDADPEIDGLKFSLQPKDSNGNVVASAGTVFVKLWKLECVENNEYIGCVNTACTKKDKDLLETWSIPINKDAYGWSGADIQLEYKKYKPQGDKYSQTGCAEITLTTPDGKNFTTIEDSIYLAGL
jgi:hypothetical protein